MAGSDIRFRVLGAVSVAAPDSTVFRARRSERLLLGVLALEPGRPVGTDRLAQLLWGDRQPSNPRRTLQVYVSRLRPQLPAPLRFHSGAYLLDTAPETVDAQRFATLVAIAREEHDPSDRAATLHEALGLWRGPVLGDAADDTLRSRLGTGLDQLRLTAVQLRVEADLELGRHDLLVAELAQLTARHPGHERLVAAHMTALHRCGRTDEALAVYQRHRSRIRDQYGLDPGPELDRLHVAVLRGDVATPPPALTPTVEKTEPAPADLPPSTGPFVGRRPQWQQLCSPVAPTDRPRVVVVDGMAGTGKTALAVRAGHALSARHPDGARFLDMAGFTPDERPPLEPADAAGRLLTSLGVDDAPPDPDEVTARLRAELDRRRLVLVLDNVADADQVRPLLPTGPGSLVLITSRRQLSELDDTERMTLSPLDTAEAEELFTAVHGTPTDPEVTAAIAHRCGGLPLALRIAAAELRDQPRWTAVRLLDRLRAGRELPGVLAGRDSVTVALTASHRRLTESERRLFRLLALTPVLPFDAECAAALADITVPRAGELLRALADEHLVMPATDGWYRLHDLAREYAGTLVHRHEAASGHRAALRRLVHHCMATARTAAYRLDPGRVSLTTDRECPNPVQVPADRTAALARLDGYREVLRHIIQIGHMEGLHDQVARLCSHLTGYYHLRCHIEDWLFTHELGLDSAIRIGDAGLRARLEHRLAGAHEAAGDHRAAAEGYHRAADRFAGLDDPIARAASLNSLGALCARYPDSTGLADPIATGIEHLEQARSIYTGLRDRKGEAIALINLAETYRASDDRDRALPRFRAAARLFDELDNPNGAANALCGIAELELLAGDDAAARTDFARALAAARQSDGIMMICVALEGLGTVCRRLDLLADAEKHHRELAALLAERPPGDPVPESARMRHAVADTLDAVGSPTEAAEQRRLSTTD